jgi:hypothetical protein
MPDTTLNAQFAAQLAKIYSDTADQVDAFIDTNHDSLQQNGDLGTFEGFEQQLTQYSEKFTDLSNDMLFTGAEDCFAQLSDATASIQQALEHIKDVNKTINIVAASLTLAENILALDIKGIATSLTGVINAGKA